MASEAMRVIRTTYTVLAFDAEGRLDTSRFEKQHFALAESVIAPVIASSADESNQPVVDATPRFIALDGRWTPSPTLARAIDEAALGQRRYARL